jgi:uncharacterized protein YukE
MRRPAGEPGTIAAGARGMGAAAGALREVRGRLRGATSSVVTAGAWRGPASEAFQLDEAALQTGLDRAAEALDQAAGALSELAARLDHGQATWDRARRLAATVGVDLDRLGDDPSPPFRSRWNPNGGVRSPADAVDPAAALVAGQAVAMATAAGQEAAAARRAAAAHLDEAAAAIGSPPAGRGTGGGHLHAGTPPGSPGGHPPAGGSHTAPAHGERHGGPVERVLNGALEVGAEVATATHHLVSAAEARLAAAGRLAAVADDPAVRAAAGRVVDTAGQPMVDGRIITALPLVAPVLDFTAAVRHGEPLPRALAGALGSAVGADLGGRLGLAACGGEAAATQGTGLIVCPTFTAVGGVLGAQAGRAAFLHVYDELTEPSDPAPAPAEAVRPGPEPPPGG